MTLNEILKVLPQYVLPHHLLSGWMSKLTHCRIIWWKNLFIRLIIRIYGVNMQEAKYQDINQYASFNDFFTRELIAGARPLADAVNALVSPADGVISQVGGIDRGQIFQAKGHSFSVMELLGGDENFARQLDRKSVV